MINNIELITLNYRKFLLNLRILNYLKKENHITNEVYEKVLLNIKKSQGKTIQQNNI